MSSCESDDYGRGLRLPSPEDSKGLNGTPLSQTGTPTDRLSLDRTFPETRRGTTYLWCSERVPTGSLSSRHRCERERLVGIHSFDVESFEGRDGSRSLSSPLSILAYGPETQEKITTEEITLMTCLHPHL